MIPKIIHYCWLSNDPIPEKLQGYINTWKEKLSDYEFILWDFNRFDINISIWVKQTFEAKKYAFAADFIRLYAVYNYGGIYLDMDIEVIKPFDNLLNKEYMFAYEDNDRKYPEAGCFGAEKGFWFIEDCLVYFKNNEYLNINKTYTLPKLMKQIYLESKKKINFLPADYFTAKCFRTGLVNVTDNTYSIHHFAGSWLNETDKKYIKNKHKIYSIFGDNKLSKNIIRIMNIPRKVKKIGFKNTVNYYYKRIFHI